MGMGMSKKTGGGEMDSDHEVNKVFNSNYKQDDHFNDDDIMDIKKVTNTDYKTKMEHYMNNYGVSIDIPGFYIQCAKFYPQNPEYCVQIIKYVIPKYEEQEIQTHHQNGTVARQSGDELYSD